MNLFLCFLSRKKFCYWNWIFFYFRISIRISTWLLWPTYSITSQPCYSTRWDAFQCTSSSSSTFAPCNTQQRCGGSQWPFPFTRTKPCVSKSLICSLYKGMWIFLQRWVVQSWVKIIQGYCKSSFQILKLWKNIQFSFFLSTIWWMDVLKRIGKITPKRLLNRKMKKNLLQFNFGLLLISHWTTGPWSYIHVI